MSKLIFPTAVLDQHLVVLGKTGAGKSSALRHVAEWLLTRQKRVCIIDPKGDWWGLKVSANGKGPGFPVVLFGNFKRESATDVPINDRSGARIAELVADGNRPCVIGMRGWTQGAMTRFWIDYSSALFNKNAGELYLLGDEFHNFAPKQWKGMNDKDTPVGVGLHWANRLLSEGRGIGLICLLASQRPQKVHNDTLTSCETLVAMRVVHKADRDAVKDWVDGAGEPEKGKEVLNSLASMPRGEAWVWSPEIGFGPERLQFPMFETFDSFAPPQLQKRVSDKGWAEVDLEEVKTALAEAVQEAEANDPKLLKTEIQKLRRELEKKAVPAKTIETEKVSVIPEKAIHELTTEIANFRKDYTTKLGLIAQGFNNLNGTKHVERIETAINKMVSGLEPPSIPHTATPRRTPVPVVSSGYDPEAGLTQYQQDIVNVLVARGPIPTPEGMLATLSKKSRKSSMFKPSLRAIVGAGYATQAGSSYLATDTAIGMFGNSAVPVSGKAASEYWIRSLPAYESSLLVVLCNEYPSAMSWEDISRISGKSLTSSAFGPAIRNLISSGFAEDVEGDVKAADVFFE